MVYDPPRKPPQLTYLFSVSMLGLDDFGILKATPNRGGGLAICSGFAQLPIGYARILVHGMDVEGDRDGENQRG